MKPKPLDWPVYLSLMTATSLISPACEKRSRSCCSVALYDRLPTYSFLAIVFSPLALKLTLSIGQVWHVIAARRCKGTGWSEKTKPSTYRFKRGLSRTLSPSLYHIRPGRCSDGRWNHRDTKGTKVARRILGSVGPGLVGLLRVIDILRAWCYSCIPIRGMHRFD